YFQIWKYLTCDFMASTHSDFSFSVSANRNKVSFFAITIQKVFFLLVKCSASNTVALDKSYSFLKICFPFLYFLRTPFSNLKKYVFHVEKYFLDFNFPSFIN